MSLINIDQLVTSTFTPSFTSTSTLASADDWSMRTAAALKGLLSQATNPTNPTNSTDPTDPTDSLGTADVLGTTHPDVADATDPTDVTNSRGSVVEEVNKVTVIHLTMVDVALVERVARLQGKLIVVYYGIPIGDPKLIAQLMIIFTERSSLSVAFSAEVAEVLTSFGVTNIEVFKPFFDVDAMLKSDLHLPTVNHFDVSIDGPVVLSSGLLIPNTRPNFLVGAYHALSTHSLPEAHLALVGPYPHIRFTYCLESQINELNLNKAWITDLKSMEERATYFRNVSVFASVGRSPDLEAIAFAMAFGVPVVATQAEGLSELCGDGVLLLPADSGQLLFAEALQATIQDIQLRTTLIAKAKERVAKHNLDGLQQLSNRVLEVAA